MKSLNIILLSVTISAGLQKIAAQGFLNLNFETTTITPVPSPGGTRYGATLPGWSWNTPTYVNGDFNSVWLNDIALDAPAVTLHGTNSFRQALQGSFSVYLQGGSTAGGLVSGNTNGASVFQTGLIPASSRSLIYLGGGAVYVTFNGQVLPRFVIGVTPSYTTWGVDVSGYAGQSGQLRFTAPWLTTGMLDGIQFSSDSIPEPSVPALSGILALCLLRTINRQTNR